MCVLPPYPYPSQPGVTGARRHLGVQASLLADQLRRRNQRAQHDFSFPAAQGGGGGYSGGGYSGGGGYGGGGGGGGGSVSHGPLRRPPHPPWKPAAVPGGGGSLPKTFAAAAHPQPHHAQAHSPFSLATALGAASVTRRTDPADPGDWHHCGRLPVHAEAVQSACYQVQKKTEPRLMPRTTRSVALKGMLFRGSSLGQSLCPPLFVVLFPELCKDAEPRSFSFMLL